MVFVILFYFLTTQSSRKDYPVSHMLKPWSSRLGEEALMALPSAVMDGKALLLTKNFRIGHFPKTGRDFEMGWARNNKFHSYTHNMSFGSSGKQRLGKHFTEG